MKYSFLFLMITMMCMGSVLQSYEFRGHDFDLIFEVMRQEALLLNLPEETKRLFHVCYESVLVQDGSIKCKIDDTTSSTKNTYRTEWHRRASCLDSDLQALRNLEDKQKTAIQDACKAIRAVVDTQGDATLKASYHDGKTALNYCYTEKIYEQLLRCGIPGQWKVWVYFNPGTATFLSASLVMAMIAAYYYIVDGSSVSEKKL